MKFSNVLATLLSVCLFLSCASRKDIAYLQDVDNQTLASISYEPVIKSDDLLSVIVAASQPDLTIPFNLPQVQGNYQDGDNQAGIKTYLVDSEGNIDFPVIGKVKLAGLTRTQAKNLLEEKIKEYIINPSVNLRMLNYKISVLGEVNKPNTYKIVSERITILEALSLAGDLTIYGKRDNILVIREIDGKKTFNRLNLTNKDFVSSPFYYLNQNDVVLVEPNKTKMNSSVIGPNISVTISALSLITTIAIILFR
ncbi:MAG TPA: polysaccharide biosynthesis/export family protein [Flavobacterium sp.]|nr:polysaccharide biosynthesis/export family protein [Flavobacterium sp.]